MPPLRYFHQLLTQQGAPAVTYYVRGTSSNIGNTETFNIQYINDRAASPETATTETVQVAADGSWEFSYSGKKIYSLLSFASLCKTTILTCDFSAADDFTRITNFGGNNTGSGAFAGCTNLTSVDLSNALLTACTNFDYVFYGCSNILTINVVNAIFGNLATLNRCFEGCSKLTTLDLSAATFASVTRVYRTFYNCSKLTTFSVPGNSTAILPSSSASDAPMDLHWSPLDYASMLKVANWLCDLTGYSAHTVTFKTSAWNALTSAEQANIDSILTAKNWTRQLA